MNKVFWSKLFNHEETLPLIFISHNSKNSNYGDIIKALLIGVGLQNHQLIYTSSSTMAYLLETIFMIFCKKDLVQSQLFYFYYLQNIFRVLFV